MSDDQTPPENPSDIDTTHTNDDGPPPRWRLLGPGLVVAATGIGAGDLVATLVAGSSSATPFSGPSLPG